MHVEIKGTDTVNKGAELMLHAAVQSMRSAFPEARMVMPPKHEDYEKRAALQLWQKLWLRRSGIQLGNLGVIVPKRLRRRYGLILDKELDLVLDASGFRYSDQFNDGPTVEMAGDVATWKKRGTKVVLLPQAFGPFTTPGIRAAFTSIANQADLIFPRDDVSYKHVTDLVGERKNIIQSPDFTNLVSGLTPDDPERFQDRYCLVPNVRMLDKTTKSDSAGYAEFCAHCLASLLQMGQQPFVLVHEGEKDAALAREIIAKVGEDIEIIRETDALKIKGILGLCSGVISSRFHALVSCLSQGTPCLATGWSHKYEMLLSEYDVPENCLTISMDKSELSQKIEGIVKEDSRKEVIGRITSASAAYKDKARTMWQEVATLVESNPPTTGEDNSL
jgi:polysaccharide pyruvyl transferase WcaK-like protein